MKRQRVDYSGFSLAKLKTPQFSYLLLLLSWPAYFLMYVVTENFIPAEKCYPVHCFLDDVIPFCEVFVLPYVLWYALTAGSIFYFMFYDVEQFKNLQTYILIMQAVAVVIYILFPTRQDLRPAEFPRDNLFSALVGLLYSADTNTGVCPSLHVGFSLGIASTWVKDRYASVKWKVFVVAFVCLICLSVVFIKQHSAVDIFAAILLGLVAEWLVFGRKKWRKNHEKIR